MGLCRRSVRTTISLAIPFGGKSLAKVFTGLLEDAYVCQPGFLVT
ncbi:MAG TPA: hypothetical protein VF524_15335 [Polyangia bacterium]